MDQMISANHKLWAMRQVVSVEQTDCKCFWINANASSIEKTMHGRRKREHIGDFILA
jgi:hypothetical protein